MADEKQNTPTDPAYDMAAKRQLHDKADDKNRVEIIRGRRVLTCGARKKRGPGFCKSFAGQGTQHPGWGRCKYCGGCSTGPTSQTGKEVAAANSRKHGLYSAVLSPAEREAYESLANDESLGLQHEIYLLKAKITVYLSTWRRKWDSLYKRKLNEKYVKYECNNPDCKATVVRGDLEQQPGYCPRSSCHNNKLTQIDTWNAKRTEEEAEAYADAQTRVWYSEGEGARSFYHAGGLEDRTLDRALNTLGRLVEKHARLNPDSGDSLLDQINTELRAASKGKVSISWSGAAQQRKDLVREGGVAHAGAGTGTAAAGNDAGQ